MKIDGSDVGLLHDMDYEGAKDDQKEHGRRSRN